MDFGLCRLPRIQTRRIPSSREMETAVHPRRYAKACDACYKKKVKCLYREPACELCVKMGQACKFTRMEKASSRRPRRGKHLAALEQRMLKMESLLERSQERPTNEKGSSDGGESSSSSTGMEHLPAAFPDDTSPSTTDIVPGSQIQLPSKEEALRLAQGFFASVNHVLPIFSRQKFTARMETAYPPTRQTGHAWWCSVLTVICYAYRLRAMSNPAQAEEENGKACPIITRLLREEAPKLSYGPPSVESAQVLLAMAAILRGSAMQDFAPMLVSVAVRMLQGLEAHKEETPESPYYADRKERARVFWVAYVLDKDIALTTRNPPVIADSDISRAPPLDYDDEGVGMVRSIDGRSEVNLFRAAQSLASIQARVWTRTLSGSADVSSTGLQTAQDELNPVLARWKNDLPFQFNQVALIGHWPKFAIIHIVVLHFTYFHTLVELNKEPPMEKDDLNPLQGNCSVARSLPTYPHSTSLVAVEAARDALDLASLTPRGNFQNVWMFFQFSISAVLTLLCNPIVLPATPSFPADLRRVDTWLTVIDVLATSASRADLLEKKDFLMHMRGWTVAVVREYHEGRGRDETQAEQVPPEEEEEEEVVVVVRWTGVVDGAEWDDGTGFHPVVFPLDQLYEGWVEEGMTWPSWPSYLGR